MASPMKTDENEVVDVILTSSLESVYLIHLVKYELDSLIS